MIKNYDPNFSGIHIVRITLMAWSYVGHIAFKIGGNCKGATLLSTDIFESGLPKLCENDCGMHECEEEGFFCYTLHDEEGNICDFEFEEAEEVMDRIVGIEIVEQITEVPKGGQV